MTNVYIKTMGCSANQAESEIMAGLLKENGSEIVDKPKDANVILTNVCTVKGETTALREIRKLKKNNPKKRFVVGGCVTDKLLSEIKIVDDKTSILNTHNFDKITEVVDKTLKGETTEILDKSNLVKVCLPKIRYNKTINIVPIASGCTSYCTYCSTKLVKGDIFSYPKDMIIKEIKSSLRQNYREIWLTSQDNSDYGLDSKEKSQLPKLLEEVSKIESNFKVRVGMMNPNSILHVLDELIEAFKSDKIFNFIHIPVQSGNNNILRKMARKYRVEDFREIVRKFRKEIKDITISTDVIVGFPTETEEEFMDTVNLIKEIKPDVLNISRFVLREGTVAELMKQYPDRIKKERSRLMTKVFDKIAKEKNKRWLGWEGTVLIDEIGKNNTFVGRNYAYKPVIVKGKVEIGDEVKVKIRETTRYNLRGKII